MSCWPLLPEWVLAFALTLFIVDIFLATEVVSWAGVLALAGYLTWRIDPPVKWLVLTFIGMFGIISVSYYWWFRIFVGEAVRKAFLRNAPDEAVNKLIGVKGSVHYVSSRAMLRWNGDELIPISNDVTGMEEGLNVIVVGFSDGTVVVKRV